MVSRVSTHASLTSSTTWSDRTHLSRSDVPLSVACVLTRGAAHEQLTTNVASYRRLSQEHRSSRCRAAWRVHVADDALLGRARAALRNALRLVVAAARAVVASANSAARDATAGSSAVSASTAAR